MVFLENMLSLSKWRQEENLNRAPLKYQCLMNLLIDSGLRLTEPVRLINLFESRVIGPFLVHLVGLSILQTPLFSAT
jgi:intergrase/recombinase